MPLSRYCVHTFKYVNNIFIVYTTKSITHVVITFDYERIKYVFMYNMYVMDYVRIEII